MGKKNNVASIYFNPILNKRSNPSRARRMIDSASANLPLVCRAEILHLEYMNIYVVYRQKADVFGDTGFRARSHQEKMISL